MPEKRGKRQETRCSKKTMVAKDRSKPTINVPRGRGGHRPTSLPPCRAGKRQKTRTRDRGGKKRTKEISGTLNPGKGGEPKKRTKKKTVRGKNKPKILTKAKRLPSTRGGRKKCEREKPGKWGHEADVGEKKGVRAGAIVECPRWKRQGQKQGKPPGKEPTGAKLGPMGQKGKTRQRGQPPASKEPSRAQRKA